MKMAKQLARIINNVLFAPITLIVIIILNYFFFNILAATILSIISLITLCALGYIELLIQKKPFAGNPQWFHRSLQTPWLIIPTKWQGWLYAAIIFTIIIIPFISTHTYAPHATLMQRFIIGLSFMMILLIDIYRVNNSVSKKNGKKIHKR